MLDEKKKHKIFKSRQKESGENTNCILYPSIRQGEVEDR